MKRFILTGAPGSGKTAILRQLEVEGFGVVEEAATDAIALAQAKGVEEMWKDPAFLDAIVSLQKERQLRNANAQCEVQFHDRSVICTAALAEYLGHPITSALASEIERIKTERIFENRVFFVRNLGFVVRTDARRISFEDTLRFEQIHEQTYRSHGFEIDPVEAGSIADRVAAIKKVAGISK
jgi:predicted ATPase